MKYKLLLIGIMLLCFAGVNANPVNVDFQISVTTQNGSVVLSDTYKNISQTYLCVAGQSFQYQSSKPYDITFDAVKPYITNISCAVSGIECELPATFKQDLATWKADVSDTFTKRIDTLPDEVIYKANITGLYSANALYATCSADLGEANAEISNMKSINTMYVGIIIFLLFIAGVLYWDKESGILDRLLNRGKEA